MYRVLSIDGGGVRGVVPALVLAELESRSGRRVADLFDFVAATSTGAILGLGLVCPGSEDRPAWSARQIVDFYEREGPAVFARSPWWVLRSANGVLGPKYDVRRLERRLRGVLGTVSLGHALCEVLVTTYDLYARTPHLFTRSGARGAEVDPPMWTVALCSSAAPTYFAAARADSANGPRWLVDGGVMANNPAMCAYAVVLRAMEAGTLARDDLFVVSIGTGSLSTDLSVPRIRTGGAMSWARPLFDVVLDGQEDIVDRELRGLLTAQRYQRFQADLPDRCEHIDDASPENMRALRHSARG